MFMLKVFFGGFFWKKVSKFKTKFKNNLSKIPVFIFGLFILFYHRIVLDSILS